MELKRLFDIMARQASEAPLPDALAAKVDGQWVRRSSAEVVATADQVSRGLLRLGVGQGDRVALISMNRPEWALVDLGILQVGAANVPIYPTATAADYEFILTHAGARVAFVSTKAIYDKLQGIREKLPQLKEVYTFDRIDGAKHWSELTELGQDGDQAALQAAKERVQGDDLASLIYTSGTTGTPKGVMLTHRNILANIEGIGSVMPTGDVKRALSFLPLSHVYERTVNYFYQTAGISIYYAESIDTIARNLKEVHPDVFVTVPRLLEKVYEGIVAKGKELTGLKKKLFDWSLQLGLAHDPDGTPGLVHGLKLAVARKLVFAKWQEALGGQLKLVLVGGSALQPRLGRVFWAAGIRCLEGYGLTETSPVIAVNTPDVHRLGTVGAVLPNLAVKIAPEEGYRPGEGEILVRGPSVMKGYYENPDATKEALTADGWFHTGDIGMLESGNILRITDRKKEMFKTSGGKYVAPLALENKFRESPYVAQIVVVGENRKFPAALVVPDGAALSTWCSERGLPFSTLKDAVTKGEVRDLFANEIERLNQGFGQWEKVKQFRLIADEWGVATGELTPKMSVKRKVVMTKYKDVIEGMYSPANLANAPVRQPHG